MNDKLMHNELRAWLAGDESSRVPVDWSSFEVTYGFAPPSAYRSFVECCGYGRLGSQWEIGVPLPRGADLAEVEECRRSVTLAGWTETMSDDIPVIEPYLVAFPSFVARLRPFVFASDYGGYARYAAWSCSEGPAEDWPVILIDFSNIRVEFAAANFRHFVASWASGKMRTMFYDLLAGENAYDWEPVSPTQQ